MPITNTFEHLKIQHGAIISATNNFHKDNLIHDGESGKVYKGELVHLEGHTMVALKRLNRRFEQGESEFWKEILMLSIYKHENIVSLLGFCDESGEKILVYRYASKRSLNLHLNNSDLTWVRRLKICIGVARGLAFLHRNPQKVLHRDIKSSNILLDENWNAMITDFRLMEFASANQQYPFLVATAAGTIGYMDPLHLETGFLTEELDVYSFGVVLFEVLCGELCLRYSESKVPTILIHMYQECYKQNNLDEIIFGSIKSEIIPSSLDAFATIAYECLNKDREARPLMEEVLRTLETALEYQVAPPPPPSPPPPPPPPPAPARSKANNVYTATSTSKDL